jgi:hypothetical protein
MAGAFVNGNYYSFADIETNIFGLSWVGFTAISYDDDIDMEQVYAAARQPVGSTAGNLKPKGSITFLRPAWNTLLAALQASSLASEYGGWRRIPIDISVSYASASGLPTVTDIIPGCRLKEIGSDNSQGSKPSEIKIGLFPSAGILWNGQPSIIEPAVAYAAG